VLNRMEWCRSLRPLQNRVAAACSPRISSSLAPY
jgi:hypothetical protein